MPIVAALCGYGLSCVKTESLPVDHLIHLSEQELNNTDAWMLSIESQPAVRAKSVRFEGRIVARYAEGEFQSCSARILLYLVDSAARDVRYGDRLMIRSSMQSTQNWIVNDGFDYGAYLEKQRIHFKSYVRRGEWTVIGHEDSFEFILSDWQASLSSLLRDSGLSESSFSLLNALLLGDKQHLADDQRAAFAKAGAMHVLAVSGLHVGIIYVILSFLLKPLKKLRRGEAIIAILSVFGLWLFAGLTGFSPSVARAATMFTCLSVGRGLKRSMHPLNAVFISAFVLLCCDPYMILQLGFQLSYLAVVAIICIQPKLDQLCHFRIRLLRWAWSLTTVSLAAQIGTAPIAYFYFEQFPTYFLVSNFIVIPAASLLLIIGIIHLLLTAIIPSLGGLTGFIIDRSVESMGTAIQLISELPMAVMNSFHIDYWHVWALYVMAVASYIWLNRKGIHWLQTLIVSISLTLALDALIFLL